MDPRIIRPLFGGPNDWPWLESTEKREAGDSRLLTAIREATGTRVDEDREREAA